MSELIFVVKSLVLASIIVVAMQVKVGSQSLESYSQWWLKKSTVSLYVQSVAAGGTLALKDLFFSVKRGVAGTVDSYHEGAKAQEAGR